MADYTEQEELSIGELKKILNITKRIKSDLNYNDKTPFVDGDIQIYKTEEKTKSDFIGVVRTQVKSRDKITTRDKTSYQVEVDALKAYKAMGGIVYFLCEVELEPYPSKCKFYYSILDNVELDRILEGKESQQTINIKLLVLPEKATYIYSTLINAFEKIKAYTSDLNKPLNFNDVINNKKFTIPKMIFPSYNEDTYATLYNQEFLLTTTHEDIPGMVFPVIVDKDQLYSIKKVIFEVSYNGEVIFENCRRIDNIDKINFTFNECVGMTLGQDSQQLQIHYKSNYIISSMTKALKFILGMMEDKLTINGEAIKGNKHSNNYTDQIIEMKNMLSAYETFNLVLTHLDARTNIDITKFSDDGAKLMLNLHAIITNKTFIGIENHKNGIYCSLLEVGEYVIGIIQDIEDSTVVVKSLFEDTPPPIIYNGKETCLYLHLKSHDFIKIINFNYENFLDYIKSVDLYNHELLEHVINVVLELIKAYDIIKEYHLLSCAESILEHLLASDSELINQEINLLNKLQIIKRTREFTFEENEMINNFEFNEEDDFNIMEKLTIMILKDEFSDELFNKLSDESKVRFNAYPISNLKLDK